MPPLDNAKILKNVDLTSPHPTFNIYNDDCLQVMQNITDGSVDLLLTDPPYNLGKFMQSRNAGVFRMRENHFVSSGWDDLEYAEWVRQMESFFNESFRVLKNKGSMIVFMSLMKLETIINLATEAGFYYKTVGVWHKTNPMPRNMKITFVNSTEAWVYFVKNGASGTFNNNEKMIHDHFETSLTPMSEKRHGKHPTQKPVKLLEKFVEILSNPDEVVLDPFMGSGSTAIASLNLKRRFIGSELDPAYFDITEKRIKDIK